MSAVCFSVGLHAQISFTRIMGPQDQTVLVPSMSTAPLGQKDAGALQVIIDYLKATNGGGWTGMQASGMLSSPQSGSNVQSSATLTILGGDAYRLDVNAPEGQRSIRVSGRDGEIQESDGSRHALPLATAQNGLLAFPRLLDTAFPGAQTTILDQGIVPIDGKGLHRISIEEPVFPGTTAIRLRNVSLLDLYFDPASHLLVKSVGSVQLDSTDRERYLQVVTYSDYRQVDGTMIPYQYTQTLNGQPQWVLQLTEAHLNPSVASDYFQF